MSFASKEIVKFNQDSLQLQLHSNKSKEEQVMHYTFYKNDLDEKVYKEAVGNDLAGFEKKILSLQTKWGAKKSDSDELRLIGPLLTRKTNPVNFALMMNNVEYFKANYKTYYKPEQYKGMLILACLCGSDKIANFLLSELKADYTTKGYEFILGDVCASDNEAWAKSIAEYMFSKNVPMPEGIYLYASWNLIESLENIFKKEKLVFNLK